MTQFPPLLSLADYQTLFESENDLYLILNKQLEVLEVNSTFNKVTGLKRADVLGKNIYQVYAQIVCNFSYQEDALHSSFDHVITTLSPHSMPVQKLNLIPNKSSKEKNVTQFFRLTNTPVLNKKHNINYIIHHLENVTDIVNYSEQDEHESQEKEIYKMMIKDITEYAVFLIDLNGTITSWHRCAERILGYQAEEVQGKSFHLFYTPEDVNNRLPESALYLAKLNGRTKQEGHLVKKNGEVFSAEIILSTILNNQGEPRGYIKIIKDLTALKDVEKIKNHFISRVSHELRTPLTSIRGAIDIILHQKEGLPDKIQYLLQIAAANTVRLNKLLNDILTIETLETDRLTLKFMDLDVNTVITEAITQCGPQAKHSDISIVYHKFDTPLMLNSDHQLLIQALGNIISNAIKFSHKGQSIKINLKKKGNYVSIFICDEGEGIPKDYQKIMYQKFTQSEDISKRKFEGLGVGLNISKKIIEKIGGKLSFKNRPTGGAKFTITLPLERKTLLQKNINRASFLICDAAMEYDPKIKTTLLKHGLKQIMFAKNTHEVKKIMAEYDIDVVIVNILRNFKDDAFIATIEEIIATFHLQVIAVPLVISKEQTYLALVLNWKDKSFSPRHLIKTVQHLVLGEYYQLPKILQVSANFNIFASAQQLLLGKANIVGVSSLKRAVEEVRFHQYALVLLDTELSEGALELLSETSHKKVPVIIFAGDRLRKDVVTKIKVALGVISKKIPEKALI